ncbi:MAG TPA: FGGY-family carbohydrate kinase [Burkholderiales bacterium]|nr:FGGY-family carbohydrate kinase [Burkholderiales bacterium]
MYYLGLDFGTTGARAAVIDGARSERWSDSVAYPSSGQQTPADWDAALDQLLQRIPAMLKPALQAIAVDGTSGTVLLADSAGRPIGPALLYHHPLSRDPAAKLLWLKQHAACSSFLLMHQVDYVNASLSGIIGISDYHNALKSGYDVREMAWRGGIYSAEDEKLLPRVVAPGTPLGKLQRIVARHYAINPDCVVCCGTTDSIAAFIAAGTDQPGFAVTSLGSTLAVKLLSDYYVEASELGVYSHKYGDLWLTGGASNSGGAVLRQYFSDAEIVRLSERIDPAVDTGLNYYPLSRPGERFPVNDPDYPPRLEPRPDNEVLWLHGLLEGMAEIERLAYARLSALGATPLRAVSTAGGGSRNRAWQELRQRRLGVPVTAAAHGDAAYGAALLAMKHA